MSAPATCPPGTKPGIAPTPTKRPGKTRPNPWRRKEPAPGEKVRPKAAYGLDTTYSESLNEAARLKRPAQGASPAMAKKSGAAVKGRVVAKIPGKVRHESLGVPVPPLAELQEEDGHVVAQSPGKVQYYGGEEKEHKKVSDPSDGEAPPKAMKQGGTTAADLIAASPGDVEYPGVDGQKKKQAGSPSDGEQPGKAMKETWMSTSRAKRVLLGEAATADEALVKVRQRFMQERVAGFTDRHGKYHGPVSAQEAEQRWTQAEPQYRQVIESDPDVRANLGIG